jgi:hypothetical protein
MATTPATSAKGINGFQPSSCISYPNPLKMTCPDSTPVDKRSEEDRYGNSLEASDGWATRAVGGTLNRPLLGWAHFDDVILKTTAPWSFKVHWLDVTCWVHVRPMDLKTASPSGLGSLTASCGCVDVAVQA